jgi:hypothetical protein
MPFIDKKQTNITIFSPLIDTLAVQLVKVAAGEIDSGALIFLNTNYKPNPYGQFVLNKWGNLVLEVVSNSFLETKLTDWQISKANELGWRSPNEENPNFWNPFPIEADKRYLARLLVEVCVVLFEVKPDTWFTFGSAPEDMTVNESEVFWHLKGNQGVVCLAGQNMELTVEGGL